MNSNGTLFMGIDVHRRTNVAQMMDGQGQELASLRFANNRTGTADLEQHLAVLAEREGFSAIHLAAEATNTYWLPLFNQLSCSSELEDWPLSLYAFNPRVIRHFKKALGDEEKTDFKDATVIAERLRFGRDLPRAFDMDEHYLPLRIPHPLSLPSGAGVGAG